MSEKKLSRKEITLPVVGITGGRDYKAKTRIFEALDSLRAEIGDFFLINGDAQGADRLTTAWCQTRGIDYRLFKANWTKFGAAAGPIRNQEMCDFGIDYLVAFPPGPKGPKSGTAGMVKICKKVLSRDRIRKIDWPSNID
jgi:hypothetical protein